MKNKSIFQKIINFIKYHNAFSIGFMIVFVGFSTALAVSPDLREEVIDALVSEEQTVKSIDNNYILTADLDNFNFSLQIKGISEDQENYYVSYTYRTIAIKDNIWQELEKEKTLTVSKQVLGNKDLGIYIAEELGEVIDYNLSYLKEVQTLERQKGLTQKIVTVQYAGLIGKLLSPKEKVFTGYEPVVQPSGPELESIVYQVDNIQEQIIGQPTTEPVSESTESVSEPIVKDNIPPDTVLDSYPLEVSSSTETTFAFHCSKQNCQFTCKIDSEFWQGCESPITYTDLFIGNHQFQVQAIDSFNQEDPIPAMFEWQIVMSSSTDSIVSTSTEQVINNTTTTTDSI